MLKQTKNTLKLGFVFIYFVDRISPTYSTIYKDITYLKIIIYIYEKIIIEFKYSIRNINDIVYCYVMKWINKSKGW